MYIYRPYVLITVDFYLSAMHFSCFTAPKKTCPQLREENFAKFRKNYYTCDVQGQETCGLWLHKCDSTNPCYLYDNLIFSVCNKRGMINILLVHSLHLLYTYAHTVIHV